uniref:Uncharacterized protein n=1 Tax=Heterorhabditis bacteriophora TaxID=37862 RepID=A0A1I7X6S5_HETBA
MQQQRPGGPIGRYAPQVVFEYYCSNLIWIFFRSMLLLIGLITAVYLKIPMVEFSCYFLLF